MRPDAELWWKQALRDLETARHCRQSADHYMAVFLCQQATEKGLKALYLSSKLQSPGPGHSLVYLGREVSIPKEMLSFLRELTPAYVATRCPDAANGLPHDNYDETIAARLIAGTEEVLAWIESQIPRPPKASENT